MGLILYQTLKSLDVFEGDASFGSLRGVGTEFAQYYVVAASFLLADLVVENGIVVFAGEMLCAIEEGCVLMQKICPEAFLGITGTLIAQHHISTWHVVLVVIGHYLANIGLIYNFVAITDACTVEIFAKSFIIEGLAYAYAMMAQLEIDGENHVFPVVMVGRHQDYALALFVISVDYLAVDNPIAAHNFRLGTGQSVDGFYKDVGQMTIVLALQFLYLLKALLGEGLD